MGPKKGQKKIEEATLATEDPLILELNKTSNTWSERATLNSKKINYIQQVLGTLSSQVEECNKELSTIYEDASLLSSLRISEYRQKINPAPPQVILKKQRTKRESSVKAAVRNSADANSTEALLATMDEKKRMKVSSALVSLFKRNTIENSNSSIISPGVGIILPAAASPPPALPLSPTPTEMLNKTQQQQQQQQQQQILPNTISSEIVTSAMTGGDARRPRDVPQELWEEVSKLRCRRIVLEESVASLTKHIEVQLERFDLLMQNQSIAAYAMDAMEHSLQVLRQKKN